MIPFIRKLEIFLLRIFKEIENKGIDEPKYLNEAILKFPGTLISAVLEESKYLYKNAIFEIVAHALNIHRDDIKSDINIKKIIKQSDKKIPIDIEDLYYSKVKNIYGQIINFVTRGQQELKLTKQQNKRLSELKLANRRMVEIIKDTKELEKNVSVFLVSDNEEIKNEYNKFRKKVVKVLRVIYLFRKKEDKDEYFNQLMILKREAKTALKEDNKSLDRLIRKNLITTDMASSLVNDNVTVNDLIKKLIQVAELLYSEKDVILETVINNKIQQWTGNNSFL